MINENGILKYEDCKTEIDLIYHYQKYINKFYGSEYMNLFFTSLSRCYDIEEIEMFLDLVKELSTRKYSYFKLFMTIQQREPILELASIEDLRNEEFMYIMFGVKNEPDFKKLS